LRRVFFVARFAVGRDGPRRAAGQLHHCPAGDSLDYVRRELADLYEQVDLQPFSTLVATEYDPSTRQLVRRERIAPLSAPAVVTAAVATRGPRPFGRVTDPRQKSWQLEGDRIVEDVQIKLSGLWVALMLTYLLGDVLRIFSGDFKAGEIGGMKVTQTMWLGIAVLMVIPIVMVFLTLTLKNPANRWANIIVAIVFFVFNLIGLPTYPSAYDKFLIVVGLVFNVLTVWYAWKWV
jgi:hypothetical protein